MKRSKMWALLIVTVGPTVLTASCTNALLLEARTAALGAAGGLISQIITDAFATVVTGVTGTAM